MKSCYTKFNLEKSNLAVSRAAAVIKLSASEDLQRHCCQFFKWGEYIILYKKE
ncbi:MAG TPA: palindromic element RPE5 domain-containing protein [Rickettsia endosymbiont of Omalisus fontisbellaquei]|nr:palindromic element RPE5 domain-containing protein [Rickettsia endosymbiont of Omalisus fontisbellaquei]